MTKTENDAVTAAVVSRMKADWNARARENARHFVQNSTAQWEDREFFRSGEISVANEVLPDMYRICGGSRSPRDLRVLEIGCGVGRMTRMLARVFGQVTGVDVSEEMIEQARRALVDSPNVELVTGNGLTLDELPSNAFDFAFSFIVFQHVPSLDVIRSYCKEVFRVLKPGSLFKFQVQGHTSLKNEPDTWLGVAVSQDDTVDLARDSGFVIERAEGARTQYFWLWFGKPWG